MIERILGFLKAAFEAPSPQSEFESWLKDKNPQNEEELEFWMKEYETRRRISSRLVAHGQYSAARHIMDA